MTDVAQCGRTFPHLAHETTRGDCPGLLAHLLRDSLLTIAEALGLQPVLRPAVDPDLRLNPVGFHQDNGCPLRKRSCDPQVDGCDGECEPVTTTLGDDLLGLSKAPRQGQHMTNPGPSRNRQPGQDVDPWAPRPSYADLMAGLTVLAEPGCQNFETGSLGLCAHNGLVQRLWCPPCTAYQTMNPTQPQEDPWAERQNPCGVTHPRLTVVGACGERGAHSKHRGTMGDQYGTVVSWGSESDI